MLPSGRSQCTTLNSMHAAPIQQFHSTAFCKLEIQSRKVFILSPISHEIGTLRVDEWHQSCHTSVAGSETPNVINPLSTLQLYLVVRLTVQ